MRILACGGRKYANVDVVRAVLAKFDPAISILIHGDQRGADRLAARVAKDLGWSEIVPFPADWDRYKKAAGHIRNQQMLDEGHPDVVIAFPGGVGTDGMVDRARRAKVPVIDLREVA